VDAAVNSVLLAPQNPEHLIVCNRSPTIFVLTNQVGGQEIRAGKLHWGAFGHGVVEWHAPEAQHVATHLSCLMAGHLAAGVVQLL
jgi:hypothetical protein